MRWIDCGDGLAFVCMGLRPARRLMLESSYALLTLKNGVPIGYVLISALFGSAEIAYNVFETFRGAETARVFGRVLAVGRHLFAVDTFSLDPYQLGHGNEEGLRSGAWWFYYKMGFRPREPEIGRLARDELRRMRRDPGHRSSLDVLRELVDGYLYLDLQTPRSDVLGQLPLGEIGLALSHSLAVDYGAARETGLRACSRRAMQLLGLRTLDGWSRGERLWWARWAPLICALDGVADWSREEKRAAVEVVRAKGGRHESDFVPRFDAHRSLRAAVLALGAPARD